MKKTLFLLLLCMFSCYVYVWAQEAKVIRIKSGEDPAKVIPITEKYRYAKFTDGKIHYLNNVSAGKLNYSILLGEIHFLDPKRDTLSLANEHMIKMVSIGENNYYFDKASGYVEELADYASVKLGIKQIMIVVNSEKEGAYGRSSAVGSIRTYNSLAISNGQVQKLNASGDILLSKGVSYFIIDQNQRIHIATRANFLKVYAKHKKEVAAYIKDENINFKSENDLKKLLQFCSGLA